MGCVLGTRAATDRRSKSTSTRRSVEESTTSTTSTQPRINEVSSVRVDKKDVVEKRIRQSTGEIRSSDRRKSKSEFSLNTAPEWPSWLSAVAGDAIKDWYVEAIREFNKILLYIYKNKQYHQRSPQYEQILKKNEQMYALLTVSLSLCPQVKLVDENVNSQLREKYGEKMLRMQRYDDEAFALYDELFSFYVIGYNPKLF